jgi:hypothetical protein
MVEEIAENIAFVMNVGGLADFESAELAPGHVLRRATESEIDDVRNTLQALSFPTYRPATTMWEVRWSDDRTRTEALPPELWRYHVVAFRGNNQTVNELIMACSLSWAEPEIGPAIFKGEHGGYVYNAGQLFQLMDEARNYPDFFIKLSLADVEEISQIRQLLRNHDQTVIDMGHITRQLNQLKTLPRFSALRFLGYFAILESLLTHQPDPNDPYDSITRQVKKKLTLLNNRFARQLDYAPFGGAGPEKIWTKLYAYRSLIAHGGQPDFSRGELAALRSPAQALALVRHATKAVARQALHEPRLLADLRDC